MEHLTLDIPEDCMGAVMERLGERRSEMRDIRVAAPVACAWNSSFPCAA